jgi:hypothetical protein
MAKFEQMVKMMTNEPSVVLKLKRGGNVKSKAAAMAGHGHQPMSMPKMSMAAEPGMAPKRPSMSSRMKAMNPNMYAKGGDVQGKQMGGRQMMGAPMSPMGRSALMGMTPDARNARAMAVRKAITGLKKGGPANQDKCDKLEKELREHKSMSADKAHAYADGGSTNKEGAEACAPKMGEVMTRNTAGKGTAGKFLSNISTSKPDRSPAKTGEVKKGNGGGFKDGGPMQYKAVGGTVSGNEKAYENTKMNTARPNTGSKTTGSVKMGNGGGYKSGGNVEGDSIDKFVTRNTVKGGDWANRPANTAKPGVTNASTGNVRLGNAGGYKEGGNAGKKHYATGGEVNSMGAAKKMPARLLSRPVANTMQSGTFKSGGEVGKAKGGSSRLSTSSRLEDPRYTQMMKEKPVVDSFRRQQQQAYVAKYPDSSTAKKYREELEMDSKSRQKN